MKIKIIESRKEKIEFLRYRKNFYKNVKKFVDNNSYVVKKILFNTTEFCKNKTIIPVMVIDNNIIICQAILIYTNLFSEYLQIAYFEALENENEAVKMLFKFAKEKAKEFGAKKIIVGINGHLNYGFGILNTNIEKNVFGDSYNPLYYNNYFKNNNFKECDMHSYIINDVNKIINFINEFDNLLANFNSDYNIRVCNKKDFDYFAKVYNDLNNNIFGEDKYYYKRSYEEDKEMLKELFMLIEYNSLIFLYKKNEPIGFLLWYKDINVYNNGTTFTFVDYIINKIREISNKVIIKVYSMLSSLNFSTFYSKVTIDRDINKYKKNFRISNNFKNNEGFYKRKNIDKLEKVNSKNVYKVVEIGLLKEYRNKILPILLYKKMFDIIKLDENCIICTSWILDNNIDSKSYCEKIGAIENNNYKIYEKNV